MISWPSPIRIAETADGRLRQETATRPHRPRGGGGEEKAPRGPCKAAGAGRTRRRACLRPCVARRVSFHLHCPISAPSQLQHPDRRGPPSPQGEDVAGLTDGRIPGRTEMILAVHLPIARIGEPLKSPAPMRAGSLARRMSVPPPHPIPPIETRRGRHGACRRNDGISGRGRPARFRRGPAARRSPAGSRPARPAASAATCP